MNLNAVYTQYALFIWSENSIPLFLHINTELLFCLWSKGIALFIVMDLFFCFTESRGPCSLNLLALSYALYNISNIITPVIQLCSLTRHWGWRDGRTVYSIRKVLDTASSNKQSTAFFASTFRFYQLLHAVRYPVWLPEATREWNEAYNELSNESVVTGLLETDVKAWLTLVV